MNASLEPWNTPALLAHAQRLLDSFRHWTGRELITRTGAEFPQARSLWEEPLVVLSHGIESDPVLNYGNRAALTLWEMDWAAFTKMPSRLTAEPLLREERQRFMARVRAQGYVDDYAGVRISATGKRFKIAQAWVWNVLDADGKLAGQAASFSAWTAV